MTVEINMQRHARLNALLTALNFEGRREILSVGANAMKIAVVDHLRREAQKRHATAHNLGAQPTYHLQKGAARVTSRSTETVGEVLIPIAGIARAFHDVTITPTHAKYLTIPVSATAYGHRAAELARMGWQIFPAGNALMGRAKGTNDKPEPLYALVKRVMQRQDRSLLPSDDDLTQSALGAMHQYVTKILSRCALS